MKHNWCDHIHRAVEDSNYADLIEDWEEDKEAGTVCYTLYDGSSLVVTVELSAAVIDGEGNHKHVEL